MSNAVNTKLSFRISSRVLALAAVAAVAGCSSINDLLEPEKIDYKSAAKASRGSKLEVPPDLTPLRSDSRYAVENAAGSATASEYSARRAAAAPAPAPAGTAATVAPPASVAEGKVAPAAISAAGLRVERAGNQRWLVSNDAPELLWPRIKDFWQANGFLISIENADAGVMETDWAENRAKIPQDFIRSTIGKVFDSLYSTGERDKFRTRLERRPGGGTEVYISHRGAEEKVTGQAMSNQNIIWTSRPSDPELEAEFIARLMTALGTDVKVAKAAVKDAKVAPLQRARIAQDGRASVVEVDEGFDRAWRRVGLALDRVGFTVEDRDRARGVYFVRYVEPDSDAKNKTEKGFFASLFSSKEDKKQALRYQIAVKGSGERSRVSVLDEKGVVASDATSTRILNLLNDQLK